MLTGQADMQTAIDAINKGGFFRFLIKPCPAEVLIGNIEDGIRQYRLVTMEKTLLEKTLRGSIEVLTEILAMANPVAFSRASRIAKLASSIASQIEGANGWEVSCAAMLSQIGCITLTHFLQEKIARSEALAPKEREEFNQHAIVTWKLLSRIPRLEVVAAAIRLQNRRFDGQSDSEDGIIGKKIPLTGRILKVVVDYDEMASQNWQPEAIVDLLRSREGAYDPYVLLALETAIRADGQKQQSWHMRELKFEELMSGMILAEDIHATSGLLILPKGHQISEFSRMRLLNFSRVGEIHGLVKVAVPVEPE